MFSRFGRLSVWIVVKSVESAINSEIADAANLKDSRVETWLIKMHSETETRPTRYIFVEN